MDTAGSAICRTENVQYRVFGIRVQSDVPLPGLGADAQANPPDVSIWLASTPLWAKRALTLPRVPYPQADFPGSREVHSLGSRGIEFFQIAYADGTLFVISRAGDRVFGHWQPPVTLEDALAYVMGPVLGIVLRRQGWACLHASAVAWDGRAVMFVGPSEAGKSTTAAAAVIRHGARMLTDDIVVLRRSGSKYFVQPGQVWLRLWNSSVRLVFGEEEPLPVLTPNFDKHYLDASRHSSLAAPLETICFLGGLEPSLPGAPALAPVSPRDALVLLAANTYSAPFVFTAERRNEFKTLSDLSLAVPAVIVPDDHTARPVDALIDAVKGKLQLGNRGAACTRWQATAQ